MNSDDIAHLSYLCNVIVQTQEYTKEFPKLLIKYSDFLLTSSSSDPNSTKPDANFQALIMVMSKLAIVSYNILPDSVFHQLFRSIVAFNLHYFSISKEEYTRFIDEWPVSFSKNYIFSILNNFFPKIEKKKIIAEFSISTLLLYVYFSNKPSTNPFLKVFEDFFTVDCYTPIFDALQVSISTSAFSVLLFYTLITQCVNFKSYCLSCVDTSWIFSLIEPIVNNLDSNSNEIAEIRLNILLIFTEDAEFSNSISKNPNGSALKIINILLSVIKHFIHNQKPKSIIVITSLSIMANLAQKISGFDAQTSDSIFTLLNFLFKNFGQDNHYMEYMRLLIAFIEAISIHRMRSNAELIYAVVRQFEIIEKINSIPNLKNDFKRSLDNLFKLRNFLDANVIKKNPKVFVYNKMLSLISTCIDTWNTDNFFQVSSFPTFTYVSNELTKSLNFFRVAVVKEIQCIL
ncbi:hypothetical protein M9Y10_034835 [Tritrichomonas musculus]|uniref:Dymeclin n=1 Tax=Tritrichomonas musculus TaxID=1915356 RepID=A0ABR2KH49_9EUKA